MNYITRCVSAQRLSPATGKWISYQLKRRGCTHADVARVAGITRAATSQVLNGKRSSIRVYGALCKVLGYQSFDDLLAAANRSVA